MIFDQNGFLMSLLFQMLEHWSRKNFKELFRMSQKDEFVEPSFSLRFFVKFLLFFNWTRFLNRLSKHRFGLKEVPLKKQLRLSVDDQQPCSPPRIENWLKIESFFEKPLCHMSKSTQIFRIHSKIPTKHSSNFPL